MTSGCTGWKIALKSGTIEKSICGAESCATASGPSFDDCLCLSASFECPIPVTARLCFIAQYGKHLLYCIPAPRKESTSCACSEIACATPCTVIAGITVNPPIRVVSSR